MIKISVVSYNNEVPAAAPSAVFDREGRTMGRSRDNYFVLDDPKNLVSRVQALVKSDGVRHTITNLSRATPIMINGHEIDTDREYDLQSGDEIHVGLFVLRAEALIRPASTSAVASQPAPRPTAVLLPKQEPAFITSHAATVVAMQRPSNVAPAPVAAPSNEAPAQSAEHHALIQAFLNGAGIPSVTLSQGLTPELMEMLGKLVAISVQGTMDLNALRALVKREVKAEVTQVVVRNNNPLKFLPDSETVLTQMFRKRMPGFMNPIEAMEDAYEDLHAHQLGVVAGMRAAMADMLKRMDPEKLEGKVKDQSFLGAVIPANRKAKLWELYIELFERLNVEVQDDYQALFGQAFLDAYEQETDRVRHHAQKP
jgi:FHA domain-containing protein